MDKASSVTAALDAGKLPSTQQLNNFIDWLNDVGITQVEPASSTDLSSRGRVLAGAIRQTLDAYRKLLNEKNGDNILQDSLWHLTEGDLSVTSEAEAQKSEVRSDIDALRSSLRTLLSVFYQGVSVEGSSLLTDFLSILRLSLADAAELIEGQAGKAKEGLRSIEEGVEKGERDALGRDKKRLEEEKDGKVMWEHGMDTVKEAGSKAIDVSRSMDQGVKEGMEKTSSRFSEAFNRISDRAKSDPNYKQALDTLFDILQKRLDSTLDAAADPNLTLAKFLQDNTEEQHISKAIDLLKKFLERLANTSIDPFVEQIRTTTTAILRDPELKGWFNDSLAFARKALAQPDFSRSDEAKHERKDLRVRWRTLLEKDEKWKNNVDNLKAEWHKIENGVNQDSVVIDVKNAQSNLVRDLEDGLSAVEGQAQASLQGAMEQATWFWQDLFTVYIPKMLNKMRDIPIPRTEYKDDEVELVLENLDISSFNLLPSHVYIRNITDMDIATSDVPSAPSRTAIGTLTHIQIQALQLKLDDISFWYRDKTAGIMTPSEFTGLMGLTLPKKGVDVDLKVRLIPSTVKGPNSREELKHFHVLEKADVTISDEVDIEIKECNHSIVSTLFKPILVSRLRDALGRTLSEQLRFVVEWADGVAFDVSKRQEVFEDTGLGGGGSLVAAIWSELGRLQRESRDDNTQFGVKATGTGVIVEQKRLVRGELGEVKGEVKTSQFAMGAEPQILSGQKRGPLGTGSEHIVDKLERVGKEVGVDVGAVQDMDVDVQGALHEAGDKAKSLMQTARGQVESFRTSVKRKVKLEESRPGWQSAAFDV